jgi:hypothetical protein
LFANKTVESCELELEAHCSLLTYFQQTYMDAK